MAQRIFSTARSLLVSAIPKQSVSKRDKLCPLLSDTAVRQLSTTVARRSLDEFFDLPDNYGKKAVKSGRSWCMGDLRLKSNSDLHKLWYVLYKERNMLYTMQEAAKECCENFPSPERIDKIEESMANLENVVRERNSAYWQLEVSPCATGERPSAFRRDVFGRPRWHQCSQHLAPYYKNKNFREQQGPGRYNETENFFRHYKEMKRKHYNYMRSRTARHIRDTFRRFPDADVEYLTEKHPEFPAGYIKHLRDNIHLYDDPPCSSVEISVKRHSLELDSHQDRRLLK